MLLTETQLKELQERKLHEILRAKGVNLEEEGLGEYLDL